MLGFEYFRQRQHTYRPSTPAAALRAIHCGLADPEELVHQGTNVKPLIEEPFDIKELQRILVDAGFYLGDLARLEELKVI